MKKILFLALLFIGCINGFAQSLTVNNNIPGVSIQYKMYGHRPPAACSAQYSDMIPTTGYMTWSMANPGVAPLVWHAPYTGGIFVYDAIHYEVLDMMGTIICSGIIGRSACFFPATLPITCIPGVHNSNWTNSGGNITVDFF